MAIDLVVSRLQCDSVDYRVLAFADDLCLIQEMMQRSIESTREAPGLLELKLKAASGR
jgi:hypothetical protein